MLLMIELYYFSNDQFLALDDCFMLIAYYYVRNWFYDNQFFLLINRYKGLFFCKINLSDNSLAKNFI